MGRHGLLQFLSDQESRRFGRWGNGSDERSGARRARRLLREYGWAERNVSRIAGWNSRLDELQAAVLRIKLPYLDGDNEARRQLALFYDQSLAECELVLPKSRPEATHVYHLYVVRSAERDELLALLRSRGVGALVHYPVPVHLQPAYYARLRGADQLPHAERAAREVLSLPIYPELTEAEAHQVVSAVRTYFEKAA